MKVFLKDHSVKDKKKLYEKKSLKEASEAYKRVANIDTKEQIFHIKDLMTKDVITLTQENTLLEAYNLMEDNDIRQIPIMSEDNHIMGLLTHKMLLDVLVNDIEFARNTIKKSINIIDLGEVITTDPISDIRRVAKVMVDFSLTAIPVVDQEDNLQGIVSRANILNAVANTPPLQIWG